MCERYVVIQDKDSRPGLVHVRRGFREEVGEMKTGKEGKEERREGQARMPIPLRIAMPLCGFRYHCGFPIPLRVSWFVRCAPLDEVRRRDDATTARIAACL